MDSASGERAVSPVIGVILMVAITVMLAAIISTAVFGFGSDVQSTPPHAGFTFDYDDTTTDADCSLGSDGTLTIVHDGGANIPAGTLNVTDGSGSVPWDAGGDGTCTAAAGGVSAGHTMQVAVDAGDTIRVVWSDGDDSATLAVWDGEDA